MFIIRGLEVIGEQIHYLCFYQRRLDISGLILPLLCIHPTNSWFPFSIVIRLVLVGAIYWLNLYCFRKASAKSFHFLILVFSSLTYQFRVDPLRLSWKKQINILSLQITSVMLLQYDQRWVFRNSSLVYLMKSDTLKSFGTIMFGTKYILAPRIGLNKSFP